MFLNLEQPPITYSCVLEKESSKWHYVKSKFFLFYEERIEEFTVQCRSIDLEYEKDGREMVLLKHRVIMFASSMSAHLKP